MVHGRDAVDADRSALRACGLQDGCVGAGGAARTREVATSARPSAGSLLRVHFSSFASKALLTVNSRPKRTEMEPHPHRRRGRSQRAAARRPRQEVDGDATCPARHTPHRHVLYKGGVSTRKDCVLIFKNDVRV